MGTSINELKIGSLQNIHIFIMVLLGTLVRLYFGFSFHPWNSAHDQLAWGASTHLLFEDFSYKNLIHYPHEGGTVPITLLSLIFFPFHNVIPPLSLAAITLDTAGRFFQIIIARQIFGSRPALWFGLWTILSIPLLLPWGTAFFGLHSVNAVLPFVFIYSVLYSPKWTKGYLPGAVAGLASAFSYHNLIFFPAYLIWLFFLKEGWREKLNRAGKFLLAGIIFFLPHLLFRLFADNGFHLEEDTILSAGRPFLDHMQPLDLSKHFLSFWTKTLPASFFLSTSEALSSSAHRWLSFSFMIIGCTALIFTKDKKRTIYLATWIIFFFACSYATSTMFMDDINKTSFYEYRHFTFIIPFLMMLCFVGLDTKTRLTPIFCGLWLMICGSFSYLYIAKTKKLADPSFTVTGWILSRKYGDDFLAMSRLTKNISVDKKNDLIFGFGWGLAAHTLYGKNPSDSLSCAKLALLYLQFPDDQETTCLKGMTFAFQKGISPVLDTNLKAITESYLKKLDRK